MTFRGFISVDVEATAEMKRFTGELENCGAPLNMVEPENIHITVKFLGDTEEKQIKDISEITRSVLKEHEPFEITIKGAGAFPHLNYMKVIWIGVEDCPELQRIAHQIEEELVPMGFSRMDKSFSPHITVARVKGGKNKEQLASVIRKYRDLEFHTQKITKIKLKESILKKSGPEYKTLEEYFL
ncbi:MAG: RNA 2',3'-cyclic phosphodiesterase [Thermoplasmata archaeon]